MLGNLYRWLFNLGKQTTESLPPLRPDIYPFVAKYSPPKFENDEYGYPEGHLYPFWEDFKRKRELLEPFRQKFEAKFQQSEDVGHYIFWTTIKLRAGSRKYSIDHSDSVLFDWLLHKDGCPKRDQANHASGWEYWYQGRIRDFRVEMANYLLENSFALRRILSEQQGLWWKYLKADLGGGMGSGKKSIYERPEHLFVGIYDHLMRTKAIYFETLVPGFFDELQRCSKKWNIKVNRSRGREQQVVDSHTTLMQLLLEIIDELNERRDDCIHFDDNVCILCEKKVKPDLARNLSLNVPNEVCAWCLKVIDYNFEPLFNEGKSENEVVSEAMQGFILAVAELKFPFWRSAIAGNALLRNLDMRRANPKRLRELVSITVAMPRDLCGFESDLHFITASGLEKISYNPKARGKKSISSCGHVCLSMGERDICEHLFSQGVPHAREPHYADLTGVEGLTEFGEMRGDFLIGTTVIEFAGMTGNIEYDEKMRLKQQLAERYGIDLLVIYPSQLSKLDELFSVLSAPADEEGSES